MEEVIATIRSALISTKGKIDLRTLNSDYQMLVGTNIPHKKFGYSNLEQFVRALPNLSITQGPNGAVLVDACANDKTKHIVGMVNKQKTIKKKQPRDRHFVPRYNTKPRFRTTNNSNWQPASSGKKWNSACVDSPRPAAVRHNQIVIGRQQEASFPAPPIRKRSVGSVFSRLGPLPSAAERLKNPSPSPPIPHKPSVNLSRLTMSHSTQTSLEYKSSRPASTSSMPSASTPLVPTPSIQTSTPKNTSSRPRMRTQLSFTTPSPMPPAPIIPMNPVHAPIRAPTPTLTQRQIETLTREGLAQFDPNNSVWQWSSSDDSSPKNEHLSPELTPKMYDIPELLRFAKAHNLTEPVIKVIPRQVKNGGSLFDCHIKVDTYSYSSYPKDCTTPEEAEKEAAREALADLIQKYSKKRQLVLSNERDVLDRIPPVIEKHFHGLWASQVALDYEDTYRERLPSNWLALIDTLPRISVEPTVDNRYVLRHCKSGEKNKASSESASSLVPLASDVSVPANTITITEEGWMVSVTLALSTVEIWCRQLETDEARNWDSMLERMNYFYDSTAEHATNINIGGFYVARYDECWCRVRVLQLHEHESLCFFIDYGDEYTVQRADIFVLQRQFAREPAQAFVCRLAGLEELADMSTACNHLDAINGEHFLAKPQPDSSQSTDGATNEPVTTISVVLYDEASAANVNQSLMKGITEDACICVLDSNTINRVHVMNADTDGYIYVQVQSEGRDKLGELMASINNVDFETEMPQMCEPNLNDTDLYLKRCGTNNIYYRCSINDRSPKGDYVQLKFIDYGTMEIVQVAKTQLFPLAQISDVLNIFPGLAIRVRVHLGEDIVPSDFADRSLSLMPDNQLVLLKVLHYDENIPVCELFRRSETNSGSLFSVNASLLWAGDDETSNSAGATLANNNNNCTMQLTQKLERLKFAAHQDEFCKPVPSAGMLTMPKLPELGEYLDVQIPVAVNPWNFIVQPYKTTEILGELMKQMQERYSVPRTPVHMEDVQAGRIYAAKHEDGNWYRTSVIKVIHPGSISVFYCDFGYYANLMISQLIWLDDEFTELPFQAMKARLTGIKPKNMKWTVDDCQYFQSLVLNKTFVSTLVDIQKDELYKCDVLLYLQLTDTSAAQDIQIEKLLIEKDIATLDT